MPGVPDANLDHLDLGGELIRVGSGDRPDRNPPPGLGGPNPGGGPSGAARRRMPTSGVVLIRCHEPFTASLLSPAEQAPDLVDHQQDREEAVEEYSQTQAHEAEPADLDGAGQAAAVQLHQQN